MSNNETHFTIKKKYKLCDPITYKLHLEVSQNGTALMNECIAKTQISINYLCSLVTPKYKEQDIILPFSVMTK